MIAEEAVQMVNSLVFRPGWTIRAGLAHMYGYGHIWVEAMEQTRDTDREYAPRYLKPKEVGDIEVFDVSGTDEDGLLYRLLQWFGRMHQHEDREFLRRGDRNLEAPFHPHRPECERRWDVAKAEAGLSEVLGKLGS